MFGHKMNGHSFIYSLMTRKGWENGFDQKSSADGDDEGRKYRTDL